MVRNGSETFAQKIRRTSSAETIKKAVSAFSECAYGVQSEVVPGAADRPERKRLGPSPGGAVSAAESAGA